MFAPLDFRPLPGLSSPHLQMLFANYSPAGEEPPSKPLFVRLTDGDQLCCQVSSPLHWQPHEATIVLLHGLGGCHLSPYMIRLARKFHRLGFRVVRINLRGCGTGAGLNKKTYTSGDSQDVLTVLHQLKKEAPHSAIQLMGFSLGGNIILKLAGELGEKASDYIGRMIAICPALDLLQSIQTIQKKENRLYHRYYLTNILKQAPKWVNKRYFNSMRELDEHITAPLWGYANALDYYKKCSSLQFIPEIRVPCDLLFAEDDPFIDHQALTRVKLSDSTRAWLTQKGSHMGFIGQDSKNRGIFWMDDYLLEWVTVHVPVPDRAVCTSKEKPLGLLSPVRRE